MSRQFVNLLAVATALAAVGSSALASTANPKHFVKPNAYPTFGPTNYVTVYGATPADTTYGTENRVGSTNLWTVNPAQPTPFTTKQEWTNLANNLVAPVPPAFVPTAVNTEPAGGFVHTTPITLGNPTLNVHAPGYITDSNNFYSFEGDYGAHVIGANYGTPISPSAAGTLVLMQTSAGLNSDYLPAVSIGDVTAPATDTTPGVITPGALTITKADGSALPSAAQVLVFDKLFQTKEVTTSFGLVPYQELTWAVWLPSYTGDFKVDFEMPVHTMLSSLRLDTGIGSMNGAPSVPNFVLVPEPAGLATAGLGLAALATRRRRRTARRD